MPSATINLRREQLIQRWQGNNTFCWNGRLMFGPDSKALCGTVLLLTAPAVAFVATTGAGLGRSYSWAFEVVMVLGWMSTITALGITATTDPGVVPRGLEPADPEQAARGTNNMTKEYHINGRTVKTKYCLTCQTYRPPRCSHCRICNNCVEKFDHHCPWVGTCIGKRNYRFFIMFISSATFVCLFTMGSCAFKIAMTARVDEIGVWEAITDDVASLILGLYSFIFVWFVGGLLVFHTFLTVSNQTTYEHFRASGGVTSRVNPYDIGCVGNCHQALCSKHVSLLDVSQEDYLAEARLEPSDTNDTTGGASSVSTQQGLELQDHTGDMFSRVTSPEPTQGSEVTWPLQEKGPRAAASDWMANYPLGGVPGSLGMTKPGSARHGV